MRYSLIFSLCFLLLASSVGAESLQSRTVAGVSFKAPAEWQETPAQSSLRAAQFLVPTAGGLSEKTELVFFYFGVGQGGDIASNIERWSGQFQNDARKVGPEVSKKLSGGKLEATVVSIQGVYKGGMGMGGGGAKSDFAFLGAIIAGPKGNIFLRLLGPKETVFAARERFDRLVESAEAEQATQ